MTELDLDELLDIEDVSRRREYLHRLLAGAASAATTRTQLDVSAICNLHVLSRGKRGEAQARRKRHLHVPSHGREGGGTGSSPGIDS